MSEKRDEIPSMTNIDFDDDLILLSMDPLEEDEDYRSEIKSHCSNSDSQSIESSNKNDFSREKKMSDITDLLDRSVLDDDDEDEQCHYLSTRIVDYLRNYQYGKDSNVSDYNQWQSEENYLKFGSKQLSPSDYQTRQSLYNRPVAFEKDSRSWARSLLENFKKPTDPTKTKSTSIEFSYYYHPVIKKSSSFDHHVQYIEHLNECNDYPAYLEYLRENRSQLFYTLTDSIDVIDGLIGGTVVSSY